MPQTRLKDLLVYCVTELRSHDPLATLLYETPPTDATERKRVYDAPTASSSSASSDAPISVAVKPMPGASRGMARGNRLESVVQIDIEASREWFEANGNLAMLAILDEVAEVMGTSHRAGLLPLGSAGGNQTIESDDGEFILPSRWRFATIVQYHNH